MSNVTHLVTRNSKLVLHNPLVRMSTTCGEVGTKGMQIRPVVAFSFMKCLSIWTYLAWSCLFLQKQTSRIKTF